LLLLPGCALLFRCHPVSHHYGTILFEG
jgi:hypothetical protein